MVNEQFANTPAVPYFAVIFTSLLSEDVKDYSIVARNMHTLALEQQGFLGIESARESIGITVSYWKNLESIKNWKNQTDHLVAQQMGREKFYTNYIVRICLVQKEYGF